MESNWYYASADGTKGPVTLAELTRLVVAGEIEAETPVWQTGRADWAPLREAAPEAIPPALPSKREPPDPPAAAPLAPETPPPEPDSSRLETPSAAASAEKPPFHPWRRYFARSFDGAVGAIPFTVILLSLPIEMAREPLNPVLNYVLVYGLVLLPTMIISGSMLALTGTTAGKWLFGIRVTNADGSRLSFGQAARREWGVLLFGQGLQIPIVGFFTNVMSWEYLESKGESRWDKELGSVVRYRVDTLFHWAMYMVALVVWAAFIVLRLVAAFSDSSPAG
jgi:uncharacterized RDD family membrane protein YckC